MGHWAGMLFGFILGIGGCWLMLMSVLESHHRAPDTWRLEG